MGVPIKLDDGTVVIAELKPGAVLTDEEREALKEFVQVLKDKPKLEDKMFNGKLRKDHDS